MKLIVIGCGNMGSAIVQAVLRQTPRRFETVNVFDLNTEKRAILEEKGALALASLEDLGIDDESVVLVAVKPQDLTPVLQALRPQWKPRALLISIAAGVPLRRLQEESGHSAVVRVMPNTPAMIGAGASGWFAAEVVTADHKQAVEDLLQSFGIAFEVSSEDELDKLTALSGSGPAYVFYFLEALVQGGVSLGLSSEMSHALAIQTVVGSAALAQKESHDEMSLQTLRANVTSKGGTTERAIATLDQHELKKTISEAMHAAYRRAKEL